MEWTKYWTVQVVSAVGGLCGILGLVALWDSPWRATLMIVIAVSGIVFFIAEQQKERVTVLFSGVKRYYSSFGLDQNRKVFELISVRYRYFGITFDSVKSAFSDWYLHRRKGDPRVQILISDPEAPEILEFQARYEIDLLTDPLTQEQRDRVALIVARTKTNIYSTLASLASLPAAASSIEVRLHRDRARRWTHEIDGETLYLGLLRRGTRGMNSPVMVLRRRKTWTLFDHHHDGWEGLWLASKPVDLATYKGATSARA